MHINYNEGDNENDNYHSNYGNNKAKEFEIKYLKELSLRKVKIDMILKEQEDDADWTIIYVDSIYTYLSFKENFLFLRYFIFNRKNKIFYIYSQ